jgi:hypothetical protein
LRDNWSSYRGPQSLFVGVAQNHNSPREVKDPENQLRLKVAMGERRFELKSSRSKKSQESESNLGAKELSRTQMDG